MSSSEAPPDPDRDGTADGPRPPLDVDGGPSEESGTPAVPWAAPRPGSSTFTIEGRAAPALYLVGWVASLSGLATVVIAVMAGGGVAATALFVVALILLSIGLVAAAGSQGIERRVRGRLPYRGPSPFLVFAAAIPVSVLAVVVLSLPLLALSIPVDGPLGALLSVSVQAIVYVGLVRLLVVDTGALDWRAMGVVRLDRRAVAQFGGGALWAIPVIFVTGIVAQILLMVFPVSPTSPLPPTGTEIGFALSFVAGAIVAPFGEEVLFRSFGTTAWARGMGARRGLVVGALFFAFAHVVTISGANAGDAFGLAAVAFLGRLPVAFALGWIFMRRGTIWASFGLHAAFNGLLLVLAEAAARAG